MPLSAAASSRAQLGGAKSTPDAETTGSPAKSDGSRIDAMTVLHGQPMASAIARTAELFPVPGAPQSSTGMPVAIAMPSASSATSCPVSMSTSSVGGLAHAVKYGADDSRVFGV